MSTLSALDECERRRVMPDARTTYVVRITFDMSNTANDDLRGSKAVRARVWSWLESLGATVRRVSVDEVESRMGETAVATAKITLLTFLGFHLNGAAGSGKYGHVSIERVKEEIKARGIFEFLARELGDDAGLSMLGPAEQEELGEEWAVLASDVNEGRKLCVDRGGLNLLVAYLLEGIQNRQRGQSR